MAHAAMVLFFLIEFHVASERIRVAEALRVWTKWANSQTTSLLSVYMLNWARMAYLPFFASPFLTVRFPLVARSRPIMSQMVSHFWSICRASPSAVP